MSSFDDVGSHRQLSSYDAVIHLDCPNCKAEAGQPCSFEFYDIGVKQKVVRIRHLPCVARLRLLEAS